MHVYMNAVMIVGGRLTPGKLLNHLTTMGTVMEHIGLNSDVNFKAAFLVCFVPHFTFVF